MDFLYMHTHLHGPLEGFPTQREGHRRHSCAQHSHPGQPASRVNPESGTVNGFSRIDFAVEMAGTNGTAHEPGQHCAPHSLIRSYVCEVRLIMKGSAEHRRQECGIRHLQPTDRL